MLEGAEPQSIALPPQGKLRHAGKRFLYQCWGVPACSQLLPCDFGAWGGDNPGFWGFCWVTSGDFLPWRGVRVGHLMSGIISTNLISPSKPIPSQREHKPTYVAGLRRTQKPSAGKTFL